MIWIFSVFVSFPVLTLVLIRRDHMLERQILSVLLCYGEMYGLQIIEMIGQDFSKEPGWGALYPSLRRLEREGYISARWGEETPEERGGSRRRYYSLSKKTPF